MKPADVMAFFVGHDDGDQHLLHVDTNGRVLWGEQTPDSNQDRVHLMTI
jgi:hypothetical protein